MSYCRWSTDDYQCAVYVFEHTGGYWQTYVAGRKVRLRDGVSFPPPVDLREDPEGYYERLRKVAEIINEKNEGVLWDWEDLPETPDGEWSYQDLTPGDCATRLEWLRNAGFHVPQRAIDRLRAEQEERGEP